jgi:hypothetical protein
VLKEVRVQYKRKALIKPQANEHKTAVSAKPSGEVQSSWMQARRTGPGMRSRRKFPEEMNLG